MRNEHYPLSMTDDSCFFEFESIGTKGVIRKVIEFGRFGDGLWNLAFGDRMRTGWSDETISNNGDMIKVMSTVVAAALQFSARHPNRGILIRPVDSKRKSLYNAIFRRHFIEIEEVFEIEGVAGKSRQAYNPDQVFDYFILTRKTANFVKK